MKKEGHPAYQDVLFVDSSTDFKFVCGTTMKPKDKAMFEGKEYPIVRLPTSSASHPFWTKSTQFADTEGRIDKFKKKYQKIAAAAEGSSDKKEDSSDKKKEESSEKKKGNKKK